jgi:hypothetical protein
VANDSAGPEGNRRREGSALSRQAGIGADIDSLVGLELVAGGSKTAGDLHQATLASTASNGPPPPSPGEDASICQTGFFGQNFGWLTGRIGHWQAFVGIGVGAELVALVILLAFFKRRGWF